jgi:hypothetical protein
LSERLLDLASTLLILAWGLKKIILPAVMISGITGALGAWLFTNLRAIQWLNQSPILCLFIYKHLEKLPISPLRVRAKQVVANFLASKD